MEVFAVTATIDINAPIRRVWDILTDLSHYADWNTFVPGMTTPALASGNILTMRVHMRPRLWVTSVETITAVEAERHLAWDTRFPAWLLRGVRHQYLESLTPATTRYSTREGFQGVLAPVIRLLFERDLQRGFTAIAHNLKARAESQ